MTKRQRLIASCYNPYYGKFATKKEVQEAKQLARGQYWDDPLDAQFCAFSPGGRRWFFPYGQSYHVDGDLQNNVFNFINNWHKSKAKRCAELWAAGLCKEAKLLDNLT